MPELTPERSILAELLGRVDGTFMPRRGKFDQKAAQNRAVQRMAWRRSGLPVTAGGGSDASRKDHERCLRRLQSAGLIRVSGRIRATAVRLTERGEQTARALCATGDVTLAGTWIPFARVAEVVSIAGRAISEPIAAGIATYDESQSETLIDLTLRLLPALSRGWIESASDNDGRVWFLLTRRGRVAFAAGRPADQVPNVTLDEAAADAYDAAMRQTEAELDTAEPPVGSPICIPVSAGIGWGCWPARLERFKNVEEVTT